MTARSFSRAPQLSSRSVSASAAETPAGRLGRRTGMPAALAAVKPASAAASGRQRSHSCWCGARGEVLERNETFVFAQWFSRHNARPFRHCEIRTLETFSNWTVFVTSCVLHRTV